MKLCRRLPSGRLFFFSGGISPSPSFHDRIDLIFLFSMYFSPCVVVPLPAVSSSPVSVYATSYSQSVSASAQQHDAHYEQHRRKAAGGKKECPSPLLLFDRRTAQLTPAEHFRLGHGSCLRRYSVILHCFTLLYFNILTSSRKSKSIGRPVPMGGRPPTDTSRRSA